MNGILWNYITVITINNVKIHQVGRDRKNNRAWTLGLAFEAVNYRWCEGSAWFVWQKFLFLLQIQPRHMFARTSIFPLFSLLYFGRNFHFCILRHFRLSEVSGGSHIHEVGSKFVYGSDLTWWGPIGFKDQNDDKSRQVCVWYLWI